MFSFDSQYEVFLADWAKTLLTTPTARAVYYIGSSVWAPSDNSVLGLRVVPNFIVRTEAPYWDDIAGMPVGRAQHGLAKDADQETLQAFYATWHSAGLTPPPARPNDSGLPFFIDEPSSYVRIIEVPAAGSWAGPEYLQRIKDGVSVERIFQESLRRYNPTTHQLDSAAHYWACDERLVTA